MLRTTQWLAVLAILACGCTHNATPPAAKTSPGTADKAASSDQGANVDAGEAAGETGRGDAASDTGNSATDDAESLAAAQEEVKELFANAESFPFEFTLPDLDDKPVSLADYKGKVVIVDIWGTWCPPCRMEIPHFIDLKKRYAEKGFDIVGINYEGSEGDEARQKIAEFVKENGINYTCVIGDEATQGQVPKLEGYPTTLFIDRAGKVRLKVVGYHKLAVLDAIVNELLPEDASVEEANGEGPSDNAKSPEPDDANLDEAADETNTEPATTESAVDDQTSAGDDAPEKTVDQLLQEAQQLAQKQDVDGMFGVLKQAHQIDPKHRQVLLYLCSVLQFQARMASQTGKPEEAYPKYLEGAGYARTLRDTYQDLEPAEKTGLVANMLYNEACAHGVGDDADKAMASLKEAVEAGFEDADQLAGDSDLVLLHDRADFKELQEKLAEKSLAAAQEEVKELFANAESFPFEFTLPDLDDKPVSLADYKGKVVIVDIWGTWCPPCRMEIPHFIDLKKRYAEKGFDIVGINYEGTEGEEAKQKIAEFVEENGINYTCVIGDEATQGQVPKLEGYPTTLFIDRAGKVRLKVVGYHKLAVLDAIVNELLPEEAPAEEASGENSAEKDAKPTDSDDAKSEDDGKDGESESDAKEESDEN